MLEIVVLLRFKSMNGVKVFSKCPEAVPFYCFDLLSLVFFFFFFFKSHYPGRSGKLILKNL